MVNVLVFGLPSPRALNSPPILHGLTRTRGICRVEKEKMIGKRLTRNNREKRKDFFIYMFILSDKNKLKKI